MAVELSSIIGSAQVPGVTAFVPPSILPGPVTLESAPSSVINEEVVAKLKAKFSPIELCAGRIMREANLGQEWQVIIAKFLSTPTNERNKIASAIKDAAGDVREGQVKEWPNFGTADELRVAQKAGRAGGVIQLTRYDFVPQILALGPGKSGAFATVRVDKKQGETDSFVFVEYGIENRSPDAVLSFPLREYSRYSFDGAEKFFRVLKEDGHEFQRCFGDPYVDFLMGLFMSVYSGAWAGDLRRMVFQQRPGSKKFGYKVSGVTYDILDPIRSPFSGVLKPMYDYFSKVDVPDTPNNQVAWLYENMPKTVKEVSSQYTRLINKLIDDWAQYSQSIHVLESSFVSHYQSLAAEAGQPAHVFGFVPCSFTQALEALEDARMYRGKKGGDGIAAILNEEGKQVGLDPLGIISPVYDDVKRYKGIVEELVARGVKRVSVYTHHSSFDLMALSKKLGIEFQVYTDHKNTPLAVRDFYFDGRDPADDCEWSIFDIFPDYKTESGAHPTLTEWNAHKKILEKVEACGVQNAIVFSRVLTEKTGKGTYDPNLKAMASTWVYAKELSISFAGCRPHNGEFIVWLSRASQKVQTKNAWFPTKDRPTCEGYAQMLVNIIQARLRLANSLRTWAFPLGNLTFEVRPRIFGVGVYEETVDPIKSAAACLADRMSSEIRALHQETKTKSTAAVFGEEQARVGLAAPPAAFFAALGGVAMEAIVPHNALPVREVVEDVLAGLIPK